MHLVKVGAFVHEFTLRYLVRSHILQMHASSGL